MRFSIRRILLPSVILIVALFSCKNNEVRKLTKEQERSGKSVPDTVWMTGLKFDPEIIEVSKGDTIVWVNKDIVAHNVTVLPHQEWTSGNIETNAMWKMAIEASFNYYCTIHPPMKGEVKVK